jgi:hypothetical protein
MTYSPEVRLPLIMVHLRGPWCSSLLSIFYPFQLDHMWNYIVIKLSSVTCMCHMHVLCIRLQLLSTLLLLSYSMHFSYFSILSCPTPTSVHFLLYTLPLLCNHPLKLWFEKTKPAPSTHIFIVPSSQKHVKLTPQTPPISHKVRPHGFTIGLVPLPDLWSTI